MLIRLACRYGENRYAARMTTIRVASRENDTGGWGFDGCLEGMMKGGFMGVLRLALVRRGRSP